MISLRRAALAVMCLCALADSAVAQGSAFALRGLGWVGRPVSGRSAGAGGSLAMFDPQMSLNPAALERWRSVAGFAVGAPTTRRFEGPAGDAKLETARFPLIGFAAPLPPRLVVGFSFSDYLDRTFTITRRDSLLLRDSIESFTDAGRSIGGVTNLTLGLGYRVNNRVSIGGAFHYYGGSTRLTTQRVWDNVVFQDVLLNSTTDFRGFGFGAGILVAGSRYEVGVSGRLNGSLLSENSSGTESRTPLPTDFNAGLRLELVPGVFVNGTLQYQGWARADAELRAANEEGARNTIAIGVGAEIQRITLGAIRTPLRFGYRMRQLPFPSLGADLDERAGSLGLGFNFARDRTTLALAVEKGSREAGSSKESFTSLFVGLTVRP